MGTKIILNETTFACYSKVCAPPPTGKGGSSRAAYLKGKRRGKSSRATGVDQPKPSLAQRKWEQAGDDAAEARQAFMTKLMSRTH
jgi:hypothetical protein